MQKQIGWDTETKLLYEIDKQLDKAIKVASAISSSTPPATTTTTTTVI